MSPLTEWPRLNPRLEVSQEIINPNLGFAPSTL